MSFILFIRLMGDACDLDDDNDGVNDDVDQCEQTAPGELVHPSDGCSIDQICPCTGPRGTNQPWKNHGKYVSCTANDFRKDGLITGSERDDIVSDAAQSGCGHN